MRGEDHVRAHERACVRGERVEITSVHVRGHACTVKGWESCPYMREGVRVW